MLFWPNHNGARPPGAARVSGASRKLAAQLGQPETTPLPGVGPKVWRKREGHTEESGEEEWQLPSSSLPGSRPEVFVNPGCGSDPGEAGRSIHMVQGKRPDGQTGSPSTEP